MEQPAAKVYYNSACPVVVRVPLLHGFLQLLYKGFARLLYRWNRSRGHW